jgi:hypothetical protein
VVIAVMVEVTDNEVRKKATEMKHSLVPKIPFGRTSTLNGRIPRR